MSEPGSDATFDAAAFLKTLTSRPGVYRMLDAEGEVLYVGKAKDLKRRVSSYFTRSLNRRIQRMVVQIRAIEVTVTHTEAEALLLEANLIKSLKPRYNVLLRDDKSYPFVYLSVGERYPRVSLYRGARSQKGRYFGPYPNVRSVRETLHILQKLFRVRQCEDSVFRNRSRPCLQYQIKRCSGPCVNRISPEDYARDVEDTMRFLDGKTTYIIDDLVARMEAASASLAFEQAARFRDQIAALRRVQEKQYVSGESGDMDIIACHLAQDSACVQVFFLRNGRNLGNKAFFPRLPRDVSEDDVLAAFISQFYGDKQIPPELLVSHDMQQQALLQTALSQQAGRKVRISHRLRGQRRHWLRMAEHNARLALEARLAGRAGMRARLENLREVLGLDDPPARMECFDISHTAGELTVASCVVFNPEGPLKSDYRRFNIKDITPGDDYAAMRQALQRRYSRIQKEEGRLPDVLFIDGGKGQLGIAREVMAELGVHEVMLVGVAKGPDRKPGMEQLFIDDAARPLLLPGNSAALHLIQQIRDEAHRFAITGHRQRRAKRQRDSTLEDIPGIGPKRRRQLLNQFGGLAELSKAGVEDIARVEGISRKLAEQIYAHFHGGA